MARIDLDQIAHSYQAAPQGEADYALKELNHVWEAGGAYALLGPSGCGKTTLLNIISGLVTPSQGRIRFDGQDVTELPTEKRNIAQVFQFPVIYDTMTVYANLAFPLRNRGEGKTLIDERVRSIAERLGLTPVLKRKAANLNADERQKISLGRGLVRGDVAAILFDEPLTVIDPHLKWQLRSQLKYLHQSFGFTMVYVTHDQTEALTFADKVVVMNDGRVLQVGTPKELFERPAHTFVGYFIGSPGMNLAPCRISGDRAYLGHHSFPLAGSYDHAPAAERLELGIRPEFLRLQAGGDGVPVAITRLDDLGHYRVARVDVAGQDWAVVLDEDSEVPAEHAVLSADPAFVNIYADGHIVAQG